MKKLILLPTIMLILCASAFSQTTTTEKKLIADETWTQENKTSIAITTSNEKIRNIITTKYKGFTRFTCALKKDRLGDYWNCTYYYPKEVFAKIDFKF